MLNTLLSTYTNLIYETIKTNLKIQKAIENEIPGAKVSLVGTTLSVENQNLRLNYEFNEIDGHWYFENLERIDDVGAHIKERLRLLKRA